MSSLKYSRQRESIKRYLSSTDKHPTADMIYTHVRKEFPNISLGTVYRNLNLLTEMGEILKLTTPDGGDRFDAMTSPHAHLFCRKCNQVVDIVIPDEAKLNFLTQNHCGCLIESHTIHFQGLCSHCKEKYDINKPKTQSVCERTETTG